VPVGRGPRRAPPGLSSAVRRHPQRDGCRLREFRGSRVGVGLHEAHQLLALTEHSSMKPGAWRLEVCPRQAAAEDLFLNVMRMDIQLICDYRIKPIETVETDEVEVATGC